MSEMKPCPFCGADNGYVDVISNPFSNDIYSRGHCIKCHAVGTFYVQSYLEGELRPSFEQMAQMATERWNTRPIEDALNARIAELEAAQRWIPVTEKLPETDGQYIGYTNIGLVSTHWFVDGRFMVTYSCKQHWLTTPTSWTLESISSGDICVTHWMPLPEPPEVQE